VLAGAGAPAVTGAASVDRFLDAAELRWTVESATAVFLPYRDATQSGAVVLAQALGVPPVTTPVGGVPEQVIDGVTGVLLDLAPVEAWSEVLWEIDRRPDWWAAMGERCREVSAAREQEAMDGWLSALGLVEGDVRERGNGR
jgi:glycosyltransferase involved in cell wall biosynthesis